MLTDPPFSIEAQAKHVRRMVSSMESLNTRIARLALALDMPLDRQGEQSQLMSCHPVAPNLPMAHQREELRGLLVLRYEVQTRCVARIGITATRQILVEAEQKLLLKGFHLGDDGIDPDFLFIKP
jgi:hypothetical protein